MGMIFVRVMRMRKKGVGERVNDVEGTIEMDLR